MIPGVTKFSATVEFLVCNFDREFQKPSHTPAISVKKAVQGAQHKWEIHFSKFSNTFVLFNHTQYPVKLTELTNPIQFLSRLSMPMHAERDIVWQIVRPSVCLSVCPSQSSIISKRMNISSE